ncbi:tyrosine-type recombinase/integrase [Streptacidiphilus sp. N1-12]|uniref:Tyrosine-type recombinase/integrase n=2 Tax=Streptacidiphilus alkalitolerans TaxID=3342712 RepID=A0ABV6V9Q8_9ACTN
MGRRPTNNPRQIPSRVCGCPVCTTKYHPDRKPSIKEADCIGSWQYRYTDPSGRDRSLNRPTYDEAVADGQAAATRVRAGNWTDPVRGKITLTELWNIYYGLRKGEDTTKARDLSLWRTHIKPRFGDWPIISIGHEEIQEWVNSLDGHLAASSAVKVFQILDRMLGFALRSRRVPYNAADGIELPKIHKVHPEDRKPPSLEQLRRVRRALPAYQRTLQIVAQETGLRWGELVGLRACWVDLDNALVQVREVVTEVGATLKRKAYPKEDASMRTVPLSWRAHGALRLHMEREKPATTKSDVSDGMHPEELVFHGRNRKNRKTHALERGPLRRSAFRKTWIRAITEAGVARVTVKTLEDGTKRHDYWPEFRDQRATVASELANMGCPEVVIQAVLGHERASSVTWIYEHASQDLAGQVQAAMRDYHKHRQLGAVA